MKFAAVVLLAPLVFADSSVDAWDVVATMAAALAEPNDAAFMKPISKSFEQHDLVGRQVRALLQTNEVVSSVSPLVNEGDDKQRMLEVDWYIEIQPRAPGAPVTQRREPIKLTMAKTGKRWMITSFAPIEFFSPPATN